MTAHHFMQRARPSGSSSNPLSSSKTGLPRQPYCTTLPSVSGTRRYSIRTYLPCLICRQVLQQHAVMSRPRRCMGLTSEFYIIGYRYRCPNCLHPTTKKKTVKFRSWDSRILGVLLPALVAEFPAYLSHCSGMSKALFSWMRMCFSNWNGCETFSDSLLAEYLLRYNELQLQYLDSIACNTVMNVWTQKQSDLRVSTTLLQRSPAAGPGDDSRKNFNISQGQNHGNFSLR